MRAGLAIVVTALTFERICFGIGTCRTAGITEIIITQEISINAGSAVARV